MAQPPHPLGKLLDFSSDFSLLSASPPPPLSMGLLCILGLSQNLHQFLQPDQLVHWLNINCYNVWSAGLKCLGRVKWGGVDC